MSQWSAARTRANPAMSMRRLATVPVPAASLGPWCAARRKSPANSPASVLATAAPHVNPEDEAVQVGGQVAVGREIARAEARNRDPRHEGPVPGKQRQHDGKDGPPGEEQHERARDQIDDADAREHPDEAHGREVEAGYAAMKRPRP